MITNLSLRKLYETSFPVRYQDSFDLIELSGYSQPILDTQYFLNIRSTASTKRLRWNLVS